MYAFLFLVPRSHAALFLRLLAQLERYYGITYTVVSLGFLSPFLGYSAASLSNNTIHMKLGQRGIAIIGAACHLVTFLVLALHPPWPVLVVFLTAAGFGEPCMPFFAPETYLV